VHVQIHLYIDIDRDGHVYITEDFLYLLMLVDTDLSFHDLPKWYTYNIMCVGFSKVGVFLKYL
jgi:hypothetical protein